MKQIMAIFMLAIFMFSALPVSAMGEKTGWSIRDVDREAVEKYNQIKERYSTAAKEWNGMSHDFKDVRGQIKKFRNLNSEDQEQVLERTRAFLTKTVERMELHLEIMESWTERIHISEERRALILAGIEDKEDQLEEYKTQIESTQTLEEMRSLAKEIKESWREFLPRSKHISGELLTAKIGGIIEDSEDLAVSLQERLDTLDQDAEEVVKMQELLDEFNTNLDLAKEQYDLAQGLYSEIDDVSDANDLFKETKEFVFAARDYLREAHKSLRELVKEYRDFTGEVPENDSEDDEEDDDNSNGGDKYPELEEDGTEE